jgi:hypothetical protein
MTAGQFISRLTDLRLPRARNSTPAQTGRRWSAVLAYLLVVTWYVLTAPGTRTEAEDAFTFAAEIERADIGSLLSGTHVSHLLFLPLGQMLFNLVRLVAQDARAYDVVRFANCLVAAIAVVWLLHLLRYRLKLSRFASIAGAAGLAVSYGFWRYANEVEVYPLAMLSTVAFCWIIFSRLGSRAAVVGAALVGSLGILIYSLSAIPVLALASSLFMSKQRFRDLAAFMLTIALAVGLVNFVAYRYVRPPHQNYVQYVTTANPSQPSQARLHFDAVPTSPIGLVHDFASMNFVFAFQGPAKFLERRFPNLHLEEEIYSTRGAGVFIRALPMATVPILILLFLGTLAYTWYVCRRPTYQAHKDDSDDRKVRNAALVLWIALYALVISVASGAAPEAWIPTILPIWILISCTVFERARQSTSHLLIVALLVVLFTHNAVIGYWMTHDGSKDYNAAKAAWLLEHARQGDLVLSADSSTFVRYIHYEAAAEVVDLTVMSPDNLPALGRRIVDHSGRVFATGGVFTLPSQVRVGDPALYQSAQQFAASVRPMFCEAFRDDFGTYFVAQNRTSTEIDCLPESGTS